MPCEKYLDRKEKKLGIFDGDNIEGMMEVGQGVGIINNIPTVKELFNEFEKQYDLALQKLIR